ncbi:MAG: hypothetical protein LUF04_13395, partial [Bacteroides sp.]|nr:hypothetical protein [Bacteroides sp.]
MAWGNLTGIRVDGYLFPFETFFRVTDASGASREDTGKERQPRPSYTRKGDMQYVKTLVHGVRYEQQVTDTGRGEARVSVSCQADTTLQSQGAFFCIAVPIFPMYAEKGFIVVDEVETATRNIQENTFTGSRLAVQGHTAEVSFKTDRPVEWQLKKLSLDTLLISIPLLPENFTRGTHGGMDLSVRTAGGGSASPVQLSLRSDRPGRLFDGLGGNFRLQNPRVDPQVIDYCLDSLRVAWGRVEMPWRNWHLLRSRLPIYEPPRPYKMWYAVIGL